MRLLILIHQDCLSLLLLLVLHPHACASVVMQAHMSAEIIFMHSTQPSIYAASLHKAGSRPKQSELANGDLHLSECFYFIYCFLRGCYFFANQHCLDIYCEPHKIDSVFLATFDPSYNV